VSAGSGGRAATLPAAGVRRAARLQDPGGCVVRFVAESPAGQIREFDFADWPVSPALQTAFAAAFAARTRPGGQVRRIGTAMNAWGHAAWLRRLPRRTEQPAPNAG
jgi:hypothetical protein